MSTKYVCDHYGCERLATYRLIARPLIQQYTAWPPLDSDALEHGVDTCDAHYAFTHPGRQGGAWWDDFSAPQTGGRIDRDRATEADVA